MTLNEAIERYKNNAEYERTHGNLQGCLEFKQLTEWLKELKAYREQGGDAISRQAAIDALSHMCSEDKNGITVSRANVNSMLRVLPSAQPDSKELSSTHKALDAISRQAAIDVANQYWYKPDIAGALAELPSVQPEPKTGKWVPDDLKWECNQCGCRIRRSNPFSGNLWNYYYCPNCGARMIDPQESEEKNENL